MSETIEFQIDSNFYKNIVNVCDKELTNSPCKVHINEHEIEVPLILALSCFSCLTNEINIDATQRDFSIDVDFKHPIDHTFIDKLVDILYMRSVTLNTDEVINLAIFGERVNNHYFLLPYEEQVRSLESTLSLDNCFDLLRKKHDFHIDVSSCSKEVTLISENFESQKSKLASIASDVTYIPIILSVITSESLKLENEDSLLDFVLNLCSIDREYESLFEHILLEYCSPSNIKSFFDYIDANIDTTKHIRPIIRCIGRRLLEPILPKTPNFLTKRHKPLVIPTHEPQLKEVTDSDPQKGILFYEHQKGNVILEASSTYGGNVYNLVKEGHPDYFETYGYSNSWIQASLKNNKPFIVRKYVIVGSTYHSTEEQLKTWKLEGKKASDGNWVVLDTHSNEQFSPKLTKVFNISNNDKLTSVRLTQTGENASGSHWFTINGFDIFGEYEP